MRKKHGQKGFTILEVLVTMSILSVIGSLAAGTFFNVYRNYQKSNISVEAKQSGQQFLSLVDRSLRDASSVNGVTTVGRVGVYVDKKPNGYLEFGCVPGTDSVNGYLYQKTSSTGNEVKMTNDDLSSGLNATNCSFSINSDPSKPSVKEVKISYHLTQSVGAPSQLEFTVDAPFDLSIVLRNQ